MKVYRRHGCTKTHRTYAAAAKCIWRRAAWVAGNGPYASLAHCRTLTVQLYPTTADAEQAKRVIDQSGCGGACRGVAGHEIVMLASPQEMTTWD